ncbi:MAG TPA: hypothetical protein VK988_14365 [Acidimicrobiales bacterium]|nr:hypothetical protein [Acidimicrobiales bacterium]
MIRAEVLLYASPQVPNKSVPVDFSQDIVPVAARQEEAKSEIHFQLQPPSRFIISVQMGEAAIRMAQILSVSSGLSDCRAERVLSAPTV